MELSECLLWHSVSFRVCKTRFEKLVHFLNADPAGMKDKVILSNASVKSELNKLNALLGPSGCGKSTLLKGLLGKHGKMPVGYTGNVRLHTYLLDWMRPKTNKSYMMNNHSKSTNEFANESITNFQSEPEMMISYVPQHDELHDHLNVLETIEFEFECKYAQPELRARIECNPLLQQNKSYVEWTRQTRTGSKSKQLKKAKLKNFLIETLLQKLLLSHIKMNRLSSCSGGERKRVSIAGELICLPNLLLLDEPTTGLDSASSLQLIRFLNECTESQSDLTVLCVIHQPSYDLFTLFDHVIVLGQNGTPVYSGQPTKMLENLQSQGLMCPDFYNPADFVLDVANGDFGDSVVQQLQQSELNKLTPYLDSIESTANWLDFTRLPRQINSFCWTHFWSLVWQTQILSLRDLHLLWMKFSTIFGFVVLNVITYGITLCSHGQCPAIDLIQRFDPAQLEQIFAWNKLQMQHFRDATGLLFIHTVIPLYTSALLPAFVLPQELRIFLLHRRNLLYSTLSYVSAKTVADIPLTVILASLYAGCSFFAHGSPFELFRLILFIISFVLGSCCIQGVGYMTGSLFLNNANASVYLTPLVSIPLFMFIDRIKAMPHRFAVFELVKYFSYGRVTFRSALLSLYGMQRCGSNLQQVFTNYTQDLRWYLEDSFGVQVERLQSPVVVSEHHWNVDDQPLFNCSRDSTTLEESCGSPGGLFDNRLLVFFVQFAANLSSEIAKQAGSLNSSNLTTWANQSEQIWPPFNPESNQMLNRTERNVISSDFELITNQSKVKNEVNAKIETGISVKFIETLMKLINGKFIDKKDGQVKSLSVIEYEIDENGIWFYMLTLLFLIIAFRIISLYLVYQHTKRY